MKRLKAADAPWPRVDHASQGALLERSIIVLLMIVTVNDAITPRFRSSCSVTTASFQKTAWIAHVKQVHGIPTLREADRARHDRDVEPCPQEKREAIEEALRHFGVI